MLQRTDVEMLGNLFFVIGEDVEDLPRTALHSSLLGEHLPGLKRIAHQLRTAEFDLVFVHCLVRTENFRCHRANASISSYIFFTPTQDAALGGGVTKERCGKRRDYRADGPAGWDGRKMDTRVKHSVRDCGTSPGRRQNP